MSFWANLGDAITGQGERDLASQTLKAQLEITSKQLDIEKERLLAKQSPEARRERTILAAIFVSGIILLIIGFVLWKRYR